MNTLAQRGALGRPRPPRLSGGGLLGQLDALLEDPLGFFERVAEQGDVVQVRIAVVQALFVRQPELVEQVLLTRANRYRKQTRGYQKLKIVLGNGLLLSEGEFWRRQRRIAQPAFHRRCLEGFAATMSSASVELAERWSERAAGEELDVSHEMNALALRIAGETLFSADVRAASTAVEDALAHVLERFLYLASTMVPFAEYIPTRANRQSKKALRELDRVVHGIIAERQRSGVEEPDLLGLLMAARDEETGQGMTPTQLRDEALTMLLAGHETTANLMAWTWFELSRNPEVARRLGDELVERVAGDTPTIEELRTLDYTERVLKESLRLHPPAWTLARSCAEADELGGFEVRPGMYVFVPPYIIHRRPELWPDPLRFDPDRWLPEEEGRRRPKARFAYFPFSGGQRQCIGDRFAMMEAMIILATLAKRFTLELRPDHEVIPDPSVTLRIRGGLPMRIRPRGANAEG